MKKAAARSWRTVQEQVRSSPPWHTNEDESTSSFPSAVWWASGRREGLEVEIRVNSAAAAALIADIVWFFP